MDTCCFPRISPAGKNSSPTTGPFYKTPSPSCFHVLLNNKLSLTAPTTAPTPPKYTKHPLRTRHRTGISYTYFTQYLMETFYTCITEWLCCTPETQHCKSTILQLFLIVIVTKNLWTWYTILILQMRKLTLSCCNHFPRGRPVTHSHICLNSKHFHYPTEIPSEAESLWKK